MDTYYDKLSFIAVTSAIPWTCYCYCYRWACSAPCCHSQLITNDPKRFHDIISLSTTHWWLISQSHLHIAGKQYKVGWLVCAIFVNARTHTNNHNNNQTHILMQTHTHTRTFRKRNFCTNQSIINHCHWIIVISAVGQLHKRSLTCSGCRSPK